MLKRGFLDAQDRADCLRIVKDGREVQRFSRRAHVLLLLDDGMTYEQVAKVLFLDDSTVRAWRRAYEDVGVESIYSLDLKGGAGLLSPLQLDELRAWATEVLPTSTTEIGQFVKERFEFD